MVKNNLGKLDRIFRFVLGVVWLSPFAPQFSMVWANWLVALVAWIVLVESFIGWCWLHKFLRVNNKDQ